jgi:IS605 OrfB family transposase
VNKATRLVVNYCVGQRIDHTIIFGENHGQKNHVNMGYLTNQKFFQIPTRLNPRISQLCEQYGIELSETEESYKSKIDADCNGAAKRLLLKRQSRTGKMPVPQELWEMSNIVRKVATMLGLDFNSHLAPFSRTGFPACSTKDEFSCGMGILPVHKKLVENGAISQF